LTEVKRTIKFIESFLEIVWKLFGNGPKSLKQPISYKPYKLVVSWVLGCGWASWGSGLALACWLRSETREQGFSVKMGKARMSTKDETGGSDEGGNKPKSVAAGSFCLIAIGVPNLWLWSLVSVSVRSLTDYNAEQGHRQGIRAHIRAGG